MEYFDVCDERGEPTGEIVERSRAHREGIRHRTAHVWILRQRDGRTEVLLQKRSRCKDSFPGLYDTSSAGHIPAGDEPAVSALRELQEELGITATEDQLAYAGRIRIRYEKVFHGRPFRDDEVIEVYVYTQPVRTEELVLQASEVEEVRWFDLEEVWEELERDSGRLCVPKEGLKLLRDWLADHA